ncbi:transmembrane protein 170A isoform X1 [Rhea pennata]|uniref:transmembrane protein 170A isoform X1 n=1 Tax=Rhea pennata TaxID=8795 RepID=UPI002E275CB8
MEGGEAGGGGGLLQQILSLRLVPRVGNGTTTYSSPLSTFPGTGGRGLAPPAAERPEAAQASRPPHAPLSLPAEMWYGVFLWALVSSLSFHIPAALLALFTLRHHKYGRFMSVSLLLMGIVGPITAGILTSAAIAGVYRAAGKKMIPFEALILGVGQTFCVVVVSFLRILATL